MAVAAQWLASLAGVWLMAVGLFMGAAPRRALKALAAMGGSNPVHFGEMAVRTVAGVVLVVAAPVSRFPDALAVIGWFLVASAVVLTVLPRRWHSAYSRWWAARIPTAAVRLLAPLSVLGGGVLIWGLFQAPP